MFFETTVVRFIHSFHQTTVVHESIISRSMAIIPRTIPRSCLIQKKGIQLEQTDLEIAPEKRFWSCSPDLFESLGVVADVVIDERLDEEVGVIIARL